MAHQSLYRKYRPQTFADVVGQDHITRTLRNAVEEGAVAHAYLFSGPRGTGKTTTARILAKALNCVKGPTPDPDDTCENCREITEGRHPDVYELDAASRTGVDAVRDEIITKVAYAATRGGWKVYIIDEVHMLSTSAFNALLKTLEEPPSHTVFVLCTTHPHKVPETIHSRCQRFEFRRIGVEDIVGRLASISSAEGIKVEDGALPLIARHALGGMRDAIGTLDQLSAFTGRSILLSDVEGLVGEVDTTRLTDLVDRIEARDAAGCFRFVAGLVESGADVPEFVRSLTRHVRDLYVVAASGGAPGAVDVTERDLERLAEQASRLGVDRLTRLLDLLGQLAGEMRWSPDPRLALEVSLARMARPVSDLTVEGLSERVAALEAGVSAAPQPQPAGVPLADTPAPEVMDAAPEQATGTSESSPQAPAAVPAGSSDQDESGPEHPDKGTAAAETVVRDHVPPPAGSVDVASLRRMWPDILRAVKAVSPMASKAFLDTEVDLDGDTLVVEFGTDRGTPMRAASSDKTRTLLRECIERVTGERLAVRYQMGRGVVRHEGPAPVPDDGGRDVSAAGDRSSSAGDAAPDAERMLIDGLGAEVIADDSAND